MKLLKFIILFFLLFDSNSCAQNIGQEIIGTWEKNTQDRIHDNRIDIGELIIYDEKLRKEKDKKKKDLRYSKYYFVFNENTHYEYRLGLGRKFEYKIENNIIYLNSYPFYKINSISNNTLIINRLGNDDLIQFSKVKLDLSDLELIKE